MPVLRTRDVQSRSLDVTTSVLPTLSLSPQRTAAPHCHTTPAGSQQPQQQCPPMLSIIAPTPRAFSFPASALTDSPYSSRNTSPVHQQHQNQYAIYQQHTLSATTGSEFDYTHRALSPESASTSGSFRTLSPVSSSRTCVSSPSPSSKRRKSSTSSSISGSDAPLPSMPRPKKGDDDYVKRPENAFILFRRQCCEDRAAADSNPKKALSDFGGESSEYPINRGASPANSAPPTSLPSTTPAPVKKPRQADLSKTISQQWKALSAEEKAYWEDLAREKKKKHGELYPNYVYRPQRVVKGGAKGAKPPRSLSAVGKGRKRSIPEDGHVLSFVVQQQPPLPPPPSFSQQHSRSSSAPTPPPYQQQQSVMSIQFPNVYAQPLNGSSPSCPSTPSVMPLISRRSPSFDFPSSEQSCGLTLDTQVYGQQQQQQQQQFFYADPRQNNNALFSPTSSISESSGPSSPHSPYSSGRPYTPSTFSSPTSSIDLSSPSRNLTHSFSRLNASDSLSSPTQSYNNNTNNGHNTMIHGYGSPLAQAYSSGDMEMDGMDFNLSGSGIDLNSMGMNDLTYPSLYDAVPADCSYNNNNNANNDAYPIPGSAWGSAWTFENQQAQTYDLQDPFALAPPFDTTPFHSSSSPPISSHSSHSSGSFSLVQEDFDLSAIPPLELGVIAPEPVESYDPNAGNGGMDDYSQEYCPPDLVDDNLYNGVNNVLEEQQHDDYLPADAQEYAELRNESIDFNTDTPGAGTYERLLFDDDHEPGGI